MTVRILTGDCRAALKRLPDKSVHMVCTSPPYFGLRSYLDADDDDKHLEIGSEESPSEYVAALVAVLREVWRALRDDGTVWLNIGDSFCAAPPGNKTVGVSAKSTLHGVSGLSQAYRERLAAGHATKRDTSKIIGLKPKDLIGIPWRVAFALQAEGWYLRSDIVWAKAQCMPESVRDRPTKSHEYVFLLTKQPRYFYDADAIREEVTNQVPYGKNTSTEARKELGHPSRYGDTDSKSGKGFSIPSIPPSQEGRRNARSVWHINPQSYSGAHFAVMPTELARKCIAAGSSSYGCCKRCGAPWVGTVAKGAPDVAWQAACGGNDDGGYDGQGTKPYAQNGVQNASDVKRRILAGMKIRGETTWFPGCTCAAGDPVPCTVLDPFGGSGTTGLVADRLGRDAVLIDLNDAYADMMEARLHADGGMFIEVVREAPPLTAALEPVSLFED